MFIQIVLRIQYLTQTNSLLLNIGNGERLANTKVAVKIQKIAQIWQLILPKTQLDNDFNKFLNLLGKGYPCLYFSYKICFDPYS